MPHPNAQYHCIGKGFCGSVWTLNRTQNTVIKREDGGPSRSITNDYTMHKLIQQTFLYHPSTQPLSIPHCHSLIQPTDPRWPMHLTRFPAGYTACRALISERIPQIPRSASDKLIDLFCDPALVYFVKTNPDDDACLIRPYLGRRRRHGQIRESMSQFQRFSLRNVPLHVDQMQMLGLDTDSYAETMADALALMYWGAGVDANDVEFVLAPPRGVEAGGASVFQSRYLGRHCMWIFDFDCCRPLSMDEVGVEQACAAFFKNDPYYPRPGTGVDADEELWMVFKRRFLLASWMVLGDADEDRWVLVEKLVEGIEAEGQSRREARDMSV